MCNPLLCRPLVSAACRVVLMLSRMSREGGWAWSDLTATAEHGQQPQGCSAQQGCGDAVHPERPCRSLLVACGCPGSHTPAHRAVHQGKLAPPAAFPGQTRHPSCCAGWAPLLILEAGVGQVTSWEGVLSNGYLGAHLLPADLLCCQPATPN